MRPLNHFTLYALAATALIAFAATSAAAADAFLKLGTIKGESAAKGGAGATIAVESWAWGEARKGWDGTIKGAASADKFGAVGGAHRDDSVDASGQKRQHGWVTVSKPLDRGSVMVKGTLPGCTVGAAYADAVLETPAARFEFKDAIITNCAMPDMSGGGGGGASTEGVILNYASYRESPTRASQK